MIKLTHFLIILFSLIANFAFGQEKNIKGTITLSGAWAIYPTAVAWAEAFQKKYPGVKIDVSAGGAGKGASDAIAGLSDIGMVSREPDPAEIQRGVLPVYISYDAVLPVINEKNPVLNDILKKGIKKQALTNLYIAGKINTWGQLIGNNVNKPVHVFTRSDSCGAAASWANFLGRKKQEDLKGVGIYGDPAILEAVRRDPVGIGYSNLSFVFTREGAVIKGIKLLPIDANENGVADPDEIYNDRKEALKAIGSNRFPTTRKNYFYVKGKPKGLIKEFIKFALSEEGTKIAEEVGTSIPLGKKERDQVLKKLE